MTNTPSQAPEIIGRRQLDRRYGKCGRTLARWMDDPRVNFPKPALRINNRRYWRIREIELWELQQAANVADAQVA